MARPAASAVGALKFRDTDRGQRLTERLFELCTRIGRAPVTVMHVCGSHEQAIARFGLRSALPPALSVIMGPGCPVCVTDAPEVDAAVTLARHGLRVATYGDMLRVPGSCASLADAKAEGACVDVVYSVTQAVAMARQSAEPVVFFGSGFETTAVATAAVLLDQPPDNFCVLSAHKYVPPAMEVVAAMPGSKIEGFLAAGHAATITGFGVFESLAERHRLPVVVAGFEPLDILCGLVQLLEMIERGTPRVVNAFPRCVTRDGNQNALRMLFEVFEPVSGDWRGIARIAAGNLQLREAFAAFDAGRRFASILESAVKPEPDPAVSACRCGDIMAGLAAPTDCALFGRACRPESPVGACMVSSEGTCRIWHAYGGVLHLEEHAPRSVTKASGGKA